MYGSLYLVASMFAQESHLFGGFHAFGDRLQAEAFCHADDRRNDGFVLQVGADVTNESR